MNEALQQAIKTFLDYGRPREGSQGYHRAWENLKWLYGKALLEKVSQQEVVSKLALSRASLERSKEKHEVKFVDLAILYAEDALAKINGHLGTNKPQPEATPAPQGEAPYNATWEFFTRTVCPECENRDLCLGELPCSHCSGGYIYAKSEAQGPARSQEAVDLIAACRDVVERFRAGYSMDNYSESKKRLNNLAMAYDSAQAALPQAGTGAPGVREAVDREAGCLAHFLGRVREASAKNPYVDELLDGADAALGSLVQAMVEADNQAPRGQREGEA